MFIKNLQRDFSCLMIGHLKNKPSIERILEAINDASRPPLPIAGLCLNKIINF